MFDITKCPIIDGYKRCKTRDGRDVRILCENIVNNDYPLSCYPIVATVTQFDGVEITKMFTIDGYVSHRTQHSSDYNDLVNIPIKKTLWVNVYSDGAAFAHMRKQKALEAIHHSERIARIKVEYEEGQFDE